MKNDKGFTLIELLIVLAIIGILTGTIVQTYIKISGPEAKKESNIKNLTVLEDAVKRYWLIERQFPASIDVLSSRGFLLRPLENPYHDGRSYQISFRGTGYLGNLENISVSAAVNVLSKNANPNDVLELTLGFPSGRDMGQVLINTLKINHLVQAASIQGNKATFSLLPVAMTSPNGNVELVVSGLYADGAAFEGSVQVQVTD